MRTGGRKAGEENEFTTRVGLSKPRTPEFRTPAGKAGVKFA
jgi:hypothetical protein